MEKQMGIHKNRLKNLFFCHAVLFFLVIFTIVSQTFAFDAYVPNSSSNNVSVIDTNTNLITDTITVGDFPAGVAITPNGQYAYVANFNGNNVSVIMTSTNTVIDTITVGTGAYEIAITPNGNYAYVTNETSSNVSVIMISNNTVIDTITVGSTPQGIAITPNGEYAYVVLDFDSSDNINVIETSTNTVVDVLTVGTNPHEIAITPNGEYAYVTNYVSNNVSVIQTSNNTVVDTIAVGTNPQGIAITPNGEYVYVTNSSASNLVSVIQTSNNTVVDTITVGSFPFAIGITPDGNYGYVVNEVANNVSVIMISNNTVIDTITVGSFPFGIAFRQGPPTVTSLNPTFGPPSGGTSVTITGTNFTGATTVDFGATPATFTVNSNTQITATSPAGTGIVNVTVTTPEGTSPTSSADEFSYSPAVTGISPSQGPVSGGTFVTITGTNFVSPATVNFGPNPATNVVVQSSTQITATSPAGTGTVDVTVTTAGGTSATSAADKFSYITIQPPTNLTVKQQKNDFGLLYERFNLLRWEASPTVGVDGYYVYRNGVKIATLNANTFKYEDHDRKKGVTTFYSVTAFDAQGNESSPISISIN